MKHRAYSLFEVKAFDESTGEFTGVASTPTIDRQGDIVVPRGAEYTLPLSLLWQHRSSEPIGLITWAKVTSAGIEVKGRVFKDLTPRIAEAWTMILAGLVRGLSIGFRPKEQEPLDPDKPWNGLRYLKWEWLELSAVTIPANAEATIQTVKAYDEQYSAASGASVVVRLNQPGVTGPVTQTKGKEMNVRQLIEQFEAKRAALAAAQDAIMTKSAEEVRTLNDEEKQTYEEQANELKEIDEHLLRLRAHEKTAKATAVQVPGDNSEGAADAGTGSRGVGDDPTPGRVVHGMKTRLEKGVRFARYALCIGAAKGNLMQAEIIANTRFKDTPEVGLALKGAVAAGTTADATWASPLAQTQEMASEFVEFLRPLTILGRIPNIRRVPFNIKFTRQTAGTTGTFVGEGAPKPLGKMDFELLSLTFAKAATIIVLTDELVRFSNPNAEILARDDLANGIARYLDIRFIDPVYAGVANVSPASITNGVTPIASLGTTIANITDTAAVALAAMIAAELDPTNLVWIMNPATALSLSLKRTSQDVFAFPGLTALGGTFLGYPVITSNSVALSGSPTESFVVLMDPTNVMLADDGGVSIEMSTEASLQMSDTPSAGAQSLVSLWQNNMVALKAERYITWRKRRDAAVQVITMNQKW